MHNGKIVSQVWDARKRRLLTEFKRHVYGVQCCAISPDEKLILSADIDSCINVRHPSSTHALSTMHSLQ